MIITTRAVFDFEGNLVEWEGFDYSGPVEECKKGRNQTATAANQANSAGKSALGIATQDQDIQGGYRKSGDALNNSMVNANGGLSPLVSKQLANEQGMIGKTYSDAAKAANRGLAMRGMGAAPTGLQSSITNTAINNAGQAQTGAVGNAFGRQLELNQGGLNYDVGQQKLYDPLRALDTATSAANAGANAGAALNKEGSTLGDIGSGLGTIMGLGGFANLGGNLMHGIPKATKAA